MVVAVGALHVLLLMQRYFFRHGYVPQKLMHFCPPSICQIMNKTMISAAGAKKKLKEEKLPTSPFYSNELLHPSR